MSSEPILIAASALAAIAIVAGTLLWAWQGWLALKRRELDNRRSDDNFGGSTAGMTRIEMADLKERIRKLEAIAAGVDL
jgi:hypothetical protein